MKIESHQVTMKSLNEYKEYHNVQASLRQWKDAPPSGDHLTLSALGLSKGLSMESASQTAAAQNMALGASEIPSALTTSPTDKPLTDEDLFSEEDLKKIRLLEKMLEKLFGRSFKFNRVGLKELKEALNNAHEGPRLPVHAQGTPANNSPQGPQRVGWGIQFNYSETHYQYEATTFEAAGKVKIEGGQTIDFQLNLHMSRETYSEFTLNYKAGDALIDPIVLRLDEMPLTMSEDKITFDLDVDGKMDQVSLPVDHAGILFLDRNHNGKADDGSELFGPTSGNGFNELRALDEDHNGWLDENDSVFSTLKLWIRSPEGDNQYLGLIDAGVGALFLSSQATEFDLQTRQQTSVGKLRETGFYLQENGKPGLIHEIDLKV